MCDCCCRLAYNKNHNIIPTIQHKIKCSNSGHGEFTFSQGCLNKEKSRMRYGGWALETYNTGESYKTNYANHKLTVCLKFVENGHERRLSLSCRTTFLTVCMQEHCGESLKYPNGCNVCKAGSSGQSCHLAGERNWAAWGDGFSSCRPMGHIRSPSRQSPSPSFIWEYDLYFLKWRVLNPTIKELRGLPWVCHSNESMAGIWGLFNREKLVFTMP